MLRGPLAVVGFVIVAIVLLAGLFSGNQRDVNRAGSILAVSVLLTVCGIVVAKLRNKSGDRAG